MTAVLDWSMAATPMFPLGSVLFPGVPIPLRVFEPRYLTLVGRLLDEQDDGPEFGVVLIERGHEAGGGDQRASVGTLARLVSVATGADDLFIVGLGTQRFSVDRWLDDDPYPRGEITLLPELEGAPGLASLWADAESVVRRVIERVAGPETAADIELSDDPVASAWQLAAIAPLGEYDRYTLLRSTSIDVLLRRLIDLTREAEELWSAQ